MQNCSGFHIAVCRLMMELERILSRLADLIFAEMQKKDCSATFFSDMCGLHRNEMGKILSGKSKDIKLSTLVRICENTRISYPEIFGYPNENLDYMLEKCYLTDGNHRWYLRNSSEKGR